MHYDVFNGDADGIIALHQLRLHNPKSDITLITGVKRDIQLLSKISDVQNSTITVFDVSLDSNRSALLQLIQADNTITYIDRSLQDVVIFDGPDAQIFRHWQQWF